MTQAVTLFVLVFVWAFFILLLWKMVGWAKKRKTGAYVFGALVHMVLPDPKIEQTVAIVKQQKEQKTEASDEQSDK
ncbi:hypothetical protein [Pseudoalteromonas sp. MMG024]|uniref:hypothetical protein n=1 Tax=Pseudoalteromonas sp. MMG024 TaxID=2909980 RepID=UPI001F2F47C4|nr:hypothetical protein [Pseudoalteromonas sp. MMG024]MCF6455925.1 hypothetical protein [Pseudoalteromonas sp. MMG024]